MKKAATPLRVIARAPFEVYFEGDAEVLSAKNAVGPFDILPGHADFFSVLTPSEVTIAPSDQSQEPVIFTITNGIVTVRDDEVMLFANM